MLMSTKSRFKRPAGALLALLIPLAVSANTLRFNGTDTRVQRGALTGFPTTAITTEFWVRTAGPDGRCIFSYSSSTADNEWTLFSPNNLRIHVGSAGAAAPLDTGIAINDGQWHHVAISWRNSDSQVEVHVDGNSVFTGVLASRVGYVFKNGGYFALGQDQDSFAGGFGDTFQGEIDDFRIWDRVLTTPEIQLRRNQALAGNEPGLFLYYPITEREGGVTFDASTNLFHGVSVGGVTRNLTEAATAPVVQLAAALGVTTNAATLAARVDGGSLATTNYFQYGTGSTALRFDGVNDYVNIDASVAPNLANQSFSVEFWARRTRANATDFLFSLGSASSLNSHLHFGFRPNNQMTFAFYLNDLNVEGGGDDLQWHHWAFTFDSGSKQRRVYRDGLLVGQDVAAGNFIGVGGLRLGFYLPTGAYFNGGLDDFRIWNGAVLEAATIREWMFKAVDNTHPDFAALDGYWKFDEATGVVAMDSSGNGRHGTFVSEPIWQSAARPALSETTSASLIVDTNAVLSLDGVTNYVAVPNGIWFNGDFTIELKAYLRAYSNWGRFLDFANGAGVDEVIFSQDGSGRLALYMVNGGGGNPATTTSLYSPLPLPLNRWVDVAVTVQGSTASLFVDGAQVASGTVAAPVGVVRTNNWIGRPHWPSETYGNELLDDVRIWNLARSAAQIREGISQAPDPGDPALLLFYRFNEPGGATAVDARSNDPQNGTLLNGATRFPLRGVTTPLVGLASGARVHFRAVAANSNGATIGPISSFATLNPGRGTAVEFDGKDDHLTGHVPQLPLNNSPYTIEAWIKPNVMNNGGIIGWGNFALNQETAFRISASGLAHQWYGNDQTIQVGDLTDGWHHVAASYDGTVRKIYLDGVVRASAPATGHNVTTTGNFAIGRTHGTEFFDGQIDEVRVWNLARTDAEVAQYMNERLVGDETGLVLYQRLDEATGTRAHDSSVQAADLLLVGGPEWAGSEAGVTIPLATTLPASQVNFGAAQLNGTVNLENTAPSRYWFEYGAVGNLNLATPQIAVPAGIALMTVNEAITNLGIAPSYTFRLVAANEHGTNYGEPQQFYMPVPAAQAALQFDGVNDQVIVGSSTAYRATTGLTVEAWIYPTGPGSIDSGIIVNKEGEYEFARYGDGTLRWALAINAPNNWTWINTGVIAPLHQWMHVAFTYDRSFVRLYTNGVLASTIAATGNIGDVSTGANDLRIGGRQGTSQFFAGAIDDVRVWLVARGAAEIAANFNRRLVLPQTGLAAYLRLDEGMGTSTANLVNSTTAALVGGPVWISSGAGIVDPVITTLPPTPVLATSATLRGLANPSGEELITYFEYGPTVAYGSTTASQNNPGSLANVPLSASLTGLDPGTTYHYRLVGRNTVVTNYGANQTFTTLVLGSGWPVSTKLTGGEASTPLHVVDGLGNTFVAGVFSGSASFKTPLTPSGGAPENAFVGKLSRKADWVWATNVPASSNSVTVIQALGVGPDGDVYVAGHFSGTNLFGATQLVADSGTNLFVAKLDRFGTNWLWAQAVGSSGVNTVRALTVIGANLFVAGQYSGAATFGSSVLTNAGSSDVFVAQLDADGNWLWANRGGGTGNDFASAVATDANTNLYVVGNYSGSVAFGATTLTNAGNTDLFVAKLTPTGTWVLARRGGGANHDFASAITRDEGNQFYLVGQFGGTADYGGTVNNLNVGNSSNIFVLRLNTEALYLDYTQGGAGQARAVTVDSVGRVYVAGDFPFATTLGTNSLISSGNSDVFIAQLIDGEWTWAQRIGSAGTETAGAISAAGDNSVVVSGTYQGTIQIGYVALSTPNNRDIFVARIDAGRVYEHNNYIVGEAIPVPLDAQDPAYTNGAIAQPIITILEKDQADSDALNSFVWSVPEHKLFPVRQVTAIFKWPLTTNVTNTTAVVTAVGRITYPTNPVVHIANTPADLEPAVSGFPLKFLNLAFTTINGASVDASTKRFTAASPGWSVVQFLESGGVLPDPLVHPSKFEVVRTVNWNDPQYLLDNQPAAIGAALTHPTHDDPEARNGYVYFANAFYDGAGNERAYDRASRSGPILPVNRDTAAAADDLVVVWYRTSANGLGWPSTPVRYIADWPTDAEELVLASRLGSGALDLLEYPSKRVYQQANPNLPGFNPNEEHAALYGDTLYALRNDLNDVVSPKASEPYTLLKYLSPDSGEWAMRVFKVVTTNATFPLLYNGVAGAELLLPEPLAFLNLCNLSNRIVAGPGFQDYLGRIYARAAGPGNTGTNIVTRYWYPLQEDFFYDLNLDGTPDAPVGTCIPWLDRRPGGIAGVPVNVTYNITWPVGVPTLQIGETLLNAKFGLPAIRDFASAHVIFDQGNPLGTNAVESLVRLFDPLSARTLQLAANFVLPATIATANDAGKLVFTDLPYSLRARLRYDELNKQLSFSGLLDESVDYGGPDNPLLLINVLSPRERERIKLLSADSSFVTAVNALYDLTRNPNRLDANRDGQADQTLLIGLTYGYATNATTGFITTNIVPEKLGEIPKALTAGPGTGSGYVTVVENNDAALSGLPVTLHVIQVADGPFRGDIKVLYPDNVFDEKLTLRHSADFGGEPQRFEFEWYYMPDDPALDHTILPTVDVNGEIAALNDWTPYPSIPPGSNGFNDITIGDGAVGGLLTLADNWFLCRYRGYAITGATNWSDWVGVVGGGGPQLAEGWVKRVVFGLNPFEARTEAFHENETVTFASMLQQAGARYEGDIAFNPSGANLNSIGLISAYQTVLNRARKLSIDAVPGINYPPANNALLLAASRISDFYVLLGNEAYADAADPTIGFRTDSAGYGTLAPSIFTFQNQLDSLLEEELVLLRGRDDRSATVRSAPAYHRLFWNFTQAEGEVAYAQAYNITDQNSDGFITADDARIMYPQGHGDAWGHYLTATKTYYALLQNANFDWIPRSESILLAGVPVQVDYLDERKFARAAAAKAKTGAELVDLTYRINYVDDPAGQYQGYKDTDPDRAWGLSEWAHRAGSAAFFDWVTANAVLPAVDPNPAHVGIEKIDRTTVAEINEILAGYDSVQEQVDKADRGLNPLGLAKNVVPFDIDPSQIDAGKTHFEQIYDRAIEAVKNTVTVFNHANQLSQALRSLQDSVNDFSQNAEQQERDYKNRLIEIFGYPYAGDIGAGRTYPSGYNGPDLYHYMYVNAVELNGETAPPSPAFSAFFTPLTTLTTNVTHFFPDDLPGLQNPSLTTSNILQVNYPQSSGAFRFVAPASWGSRPAPGEIQLASSELLQSQARLKQALFNYDNLIQQIQDQMDLLAARHDLESTTIQLRDGVAGKITVLQSVIAGARALSRTFESVIQANEDINNILVEAMPKVVGLSTDATAPARAAVKASKFPLDKALMAGVLLAEGTAEGVSIHIEKLREQTALAIEAEGFQFEIQERLKEVEQLIREEAVLRAEAFELTEAVNQNVGRYQAAVTRGLRLIEERIAFRKNAAAETQASRYQDMTFRIFRNDAIQKYRAQFDLAAQYVFLAAVAYDFETQLLGGRPGAGREFLTDIVRQRALGEVVNGVPVAGRHGLADPLARLSQNFGVLKGQLGFNNPQTETGRFSLRRELLRLRDTSDEQWRVELKNSVVRNLWDVPEFRRYCRPFAPESAGPQPGLVIRFPTTVTFGLNYFGWPLGGGDSAYDPTLFATKVRSAGVWFEDYLGSGLSQTPRVYLVPVGADVMRSPSGNDLQTREWRVVDQKIPVPFPIGFSSLNNAAWIPLNDSLSDTFADIRRFSSFRAYHDSGVFNPAETVTDSRLIGRSVWNTDWMLIIPGGTFLFDPDQGLDAFINSVGDIKIFFQTYAYSGD